MCRNALYSKQGVELIEREYGLVNMLDFLEKNCGGHGNGIILVKDNQIVFTKKGMKYSNEKIAADLSKRDFDWFIYHTRISSVGTVSDSNCHPYINRKKTFGLIMNGTVTGLSSVAKHADITDTQMLFEFYDKHNIPLEKLLDISCKFIGFKDGKVFASNPTSFGMEFLVDGEAIVIQSTFPKDFERISETKNMDVQFWTEGEEIRERKYVTATQTNYMIDGSWYYGGGGYRSSLERNAYSAEKSWKLEHYTTSMSDKKKNFVNQLTEKLDIKNKNIYEMNIGEVDIYIDAGLFTYEGIHADNTCYIDKIDIKNNIVETYMFDVENL